MSVPEPSPAEQAVIDRSGIFAAEEGDLRRCSECGAICDARVQACECAPDCPLPKVAR